MLLVGAVGAMLYLVGLLPLIMLVFAFVLSIIAPFLDVPAMVRAGKLRYCSPFLLCEAEQHGTVTLHAGTLFDSWFLFREDMSAGERKTLATAWMVEGLINLIEDHERAGQRELKVRTTSYILNERTAGKLGPQRRVPYKFRRKRRISCAAPLGRSDGYCHSCRNTRSAAFPTETRSVQSYSEVP